MAGNIIIYVEFIFLDSFIAHLNLQGKSLTDSFSVMVFIIHPFFKLTSLNTIVKVTLTNLFILFYFLIFCAS